MRRPYGLLFVLCLGCPSATRSKKDGSDSDATAQAKSAAEPSSASATRTPDQIRAQGNHLVGEASPYLQQHAHNPVDWYPWSPEALRKAKREKKPIFLSIGYSTCHWCHVMERESFEDDEIAAFLNEHFVSIKVDREQRPDVDALYIDAVAAMGGSTGWPLTVFLTPDLEPFFGGTYFPPRAQDGRPGFVDVLHRVDEQWREQGEAVAQRGRQVLAQIERSALRAAQQPGSISTQTLDEAMQSLERHRDPVHGGFGSRQKFPNAPLLLAELRHVQRTSDEATREHLVTTLESMLAGGIRDHVGGSFHRYTVDPRWHVPHFEKTLYDNAQLAGLYLEAGRALDRPDFVAAGKAVLDDLIEHWQRPDGGLVVGFDADDAGGEGTYYTWTPAELQDVLGPDDAKIVAAAFGVEAQGEPELGGRSVLHRKDDAVVARTLSISTGKVETTVAAALPRLARARTERDAPAVDDKELTAWNGLALMTFSDAARWLNEPRYAAAASEIGTFLMNSASSGGSLSRGLRQGKRLGDGVLADYALAGLGLLRLHAATGEIRWLAGARELGVQMVERFWDPQRKTFMQTPEDAAGLPVRLADMDDGVLPSGGSAATLLLLELGAIAGEQRLLEIAESVLERTAGRAASQPTSAGFMLVALDHAAATVREVVVAGDDNDTKARALWATVTPTSFSRILPVRLPAEGPSDELEEHFPALAGKVARRGTPTAYVCQRGSCKAPTHDPAALAKQLATDPPEPRPEKD